MLRAMDSSASGQVPLTIAIATNDGWHAVRQAYRAIRGQAEDAGAEVILVDGSGGGAPLPTEIGPTTRWLEMPGSDIAEMRARAYREARGELIAMTEDHVEGAPDWVSVILGAHDEYPEAAAIGGAVRNGTPGHLVDWASFYAGHAPFLEPLADGPAEYLSGINVSYKRDALLAALNALGGDRAIETLINDQIKAAGGALRADSRMIVSHFQSRGVANTFRLHFYAGQHFEGTRRESHSDAPARIVRALALPLPRAAKRLATALRRGQPVGRVAAATPAMLMVAYSQALGEIVGAVKGPGRAATKLH
jgi:hypothetical protein